jgi:hypothetical protein
MSRVAVKVVPSCVVAVAAETTGEALADSTTSSCVRVDSALPVSLVMSGS